MAGDGGRVPDVSEQRATVVRAGVNAVQEEFDERGLGDASLLVQVILDEALSDPASVLAALLAESPEATVSAIEALLTSDEAVEVVARFVSQQWHHAEDVDVDDYDRQEARKLIPLICRSLLSKAPKGDGDA